MKKIKKIIISIIAILIIIATCLSIWNYNSKVAYALTVPPYHPFTDEFVAPSFEEIKSKSPSYFLGKSGVEITFRAHTNPPSETKQYYSRISDDRLRVDGKFNPNLGCMEISSNGASNSGLDCIAVLDINLDGTGNKGDFVCYSRANPGGVRGTSDAAAKIAYVSWLSEYWSWENNPRGLYITESMSGYKNTVLSCLFEGVPGEGPLINQLGFSFPSSYSWNNPGAIGGFANQYVSTGKDMSIQGRINSRSGTVLDHRQDSYKVWYDDECLYDTEVTCSARVLFFVGPYSQDSMVMHGSVKSSSAGIDKYITSTDPAPTADPKNFSDRPGQTDDWKYSDEHAVKVSEKDTKITYHIVLDNPGDSEIEVKFQDDYSDGSCLDYVSSTLSGLQNNSGRRLLKSDSIKIPAKSKKEFDIVLKFDGSKISGKYKNIAKVKLKSDTSSDDDDDSWNKSTDTIMIKIAEPEIKKYITSITNGGDLKGDRSTFTEAQKRTTPAEAETKVEHTVTYKIEIKNPTDEAITGKFTDQISPSLPMNISNATNGGNITIDAKSTYKITITVTVSAEAWATTYTNTSKFYYNNKEYISVDVFKLKEKPEPQIPSGTLKKYISEAHSTFGNREGWSTQDKYDTPAESAHGETVTYTLKFKVNGLYYENTCGTDESGSQWNQYENNYKQKNGDVDIIFTDWYDEGLEYAGGYIESPGENGGIQYSYLGYDGVSNIDGVTNVKKSQITLKDCKMNKTGETEITVKLNFNVTASDMRLPNLQNKMGEVKYSYTRYDSYWTARWYHDGTYTRHYIYNEDDEVTGYWDEPNMVHDYNDGTWNPGASTIGPALLPGTENDFGFDYVRILDPYIGGYVWIDNGDGIRSPGEGGLSGSNITAKTAEIEKPTYANINVKLWKSDGTFIAETITSGGHYSFGRVRKGAIRNEEMKGPDASGLFNTYANFGENHKFYYNGASLVTYFITFEYNGERYISAVKDSEASIRKERDISDYQTVLGIDSDAGEEDQARKWFNESLETISYNAAWWNGGGPKPLDYEEKGNSLQTSTLNWDGSGVGSGGNYSSYYPEEGYFKNSVNANRSITMLVKTKNIYFSENYTEDQYTGGAMYAQNIDLGLVERPKDTDLELKKDVVQAEVTINNHRTIYTYEQLDNGGEYTTTASNTISKPYILRIYREDYEYRTKKYSTEIQNILNANNTAIYNAINHDEGLDRGNDLEILITYKITVTNNSTSATATLREIVDYTRQMQIKQATYNAIDGIKLNFGVTNYTEARYTPNSGANEYKTYINTTPNGSAISIGAGDSTTIYVKCLVDKDSNGYILKDSLSSQFGKLNVGEVSSYSFYISGQPAGLVDQDSNPGNADPTDASKNEDDTFNATVLVLLRDEDGEDDDGGGNGKKKDYRNITGIVFEEVEKNGAPEDGQKLGNGQMNYNDDDIDHSEDVPANGVLVKLYEVVTDYTNAIDYYVDTGMWYRTWVDRTIEDVDGNITHEGNPKNPENGRYYFGDGSDVGHGAYGESTEDKNKLHPGVYTVRFIYGDERDYLLTTDGTLIKYTGQDYQSTVYTDPRIAPNQEANEIINPGNTETEIVKSSLFAKLSKNEKFFDGANPSLADTDNGEIIYSVAKDNEIRRLEVNKYSTTTTYLMDTVLKSNNSLGLIGPGLTGTDEEKKLKIPETPQVMTDIVQEVDLLAEHTVMYADSKFFDMDIEYFTNYEDKEKYTISGMFTEFSASVDSTGKFSVSGINTNGKYYHAVRDLNFGMAERPRTKLQLMNDITEIIAVTSDGNPLVDMVFDVIYEKPAEEGGEINHVSAVNFDKSQNYEEVQVLNRRANNQGFRYVNMDTDLLQGMKITVKYRIAIANISDVDHIDKAFQDKMKEEGLVTELEVEYGVEAANANTYTSGNKIVDIINILGKESGVTGSAEVKRSQTRTYNYENNYLYKVVGNLQGGLNGLNTDNQSYDGITPVGPESVRRTYSYRNIKKSVTSDYEVGYYLGTIYYKGKKDQTGIAGKTETKVETRVDQFIDYVDNDLIFKVEENVLTISDKDKIAGIDGGIDKNAGKDNQVQYLTYTTKEISERGLLKDIIYDAKYDDEGRPIEEYSPVKVITDCEKDYYNEDKPTTNNNLAFNIEQEGVIINNYKDDPITLGVYKFLPPVADEAYRPIRDIEHTIPANPSLDEEGTDPIRHYYDYYDNNTANNSKYDLKPDLYSIGNPYYDRSVEDIGYDPVALDSYYLHDEGFGTVSDEQSYDYNREINKWLYVMDLESSVILSSELENIVIDNLAEIVKATNTVGRKVYVVSSNSTSMSQGYIGNTTKKPIEQAKLLGLVEISKPEIDTDFTEFVTFSPPTGLNSDQAIIRTLEENTINAMLIIIPTLIIIVGLTYVGIQLKHRKKFYK